MTDAEILTTDEFAERPDGTRKATRLSPDVIGTVKSAQATEDTAG